MFRYKIIIRQLLRNTSNTIIKVVSLIIGLTVSLLVFLQIAHELNYDNFHPDKDRMYRIGVIWNNKGEIDDGPVIIAPLAQALKDNLPEVEDFALIRKGWGSRFYTSNKQAINVRSVYADSTFFQFFNFPITKRSTNNELSKPYRVLISETTADKFFGGSDPLGKIIYDTNQKPFEIEGVFEDVPENSHLDFDLVVSFETIRADGSLYTGWGGGDSFNGYLKLVAGASVEAVESKIPEVIAKYEDNSKDEASGQSETFYMQRLTDINTVHNVYKTIVLGIMGAIGLIVLIISVLNFVLLTLTSFQKQVYNLGIQQYAGASKTDIVKSVAIEQLLMVTLAALITAALLKPVINLSSNVWGWADSILFNWYSALFALGIIAFVLVLAIGLPILKIGGKKFKLALAKKGTSKIEAIGKRALLATQMVGVTVLMVVLFMLIKQMNYVERMQLGYQTENRAFIRLQGDEQYKKAPYLMDELNSFSFVESTAASTMLITDGLSGNSYGLPGNKDEYWISRYLYVDKNFQETMGLKLTDGLDFSALSEYDNNAVLVNHELVKRMNWDNPVGQEITSNMSENNFRVVGVVDDFMRSAHMNKLPAIFYKIPDDKIAKYATNISVKFRAGTTARQIKQVNDLLKAESNVVPMELGFYDMEVAAFYSTERQLKGALMLFAALAMFLAVVGLAGFVLNEVQQRTKEIGIRKVNGATISEVLVMLNCDYTRWVLLAFIIAIPLAYFAVQQGFQMYAYKTEISWWIFALASVLALGIALLTVSWQSWRAATRNPVEALRYE